MSLVAHEFYTSLSKYVITNCVFDRWMDDCTERADYKPHSFSRLFTAVYLVHNIETVKCNQHKVINVHAGTSAAAIPPKFSDIP